MAPEFAHPIHLVEELGLQLAELIMFLRIFKIESARRNNSTNIERSGRDGDIPDFAAAGQFLPDESDFDRDE